MRRGLHALSWMVARRAAGSTEMSEGASTASIYSGGFLYL